MFVYLIVKSTYVYRISNAQTLQFSNYLSIGRFYRCADLTRLVDLILISYSRMPVDFIMHHFDVLEMTDHFREFRHQPPLLDHTG